jgi:hypothetical protein
VTFGDTEQGRDVGKRLIQSYAHQAISIILGEEPVPLMHSIVHALITSVQDEMNIRIPVALLSLLCIWLHEHPASVSQFLSEGSNLQAVSVQYRR